jgi:hypothetical protein
MTTRFRRLGEFTAMGILLLSVFATTAYMNHSLGKHWARTANPFTLSLGDNVAPIWDAYLTKASSDWNASPAELTVLQTRIVPGGSKSGKCQPTKGRVEVCNSSLGGSTLGKASIWTTGNHITQATVQVNDYLLYGPFRFNTEAWRQYVICQEIGHTLGLDHEDEDTLNPNVGTCMDYTEDPSGTNTEPDQVANTQPNYHDYEELEIIYGHVDSTNTVFNAVGTALNTLQAPMTGADVDTSDPSQWGKLVRRSVNGKNLLFERDLGNGSKIFTFVLLAN